MWQRKRAHHRQIRDRRMPMSLGRFSNDFLELSQVSEAFLIMCGQNCMLYEIGTLGLTCGLHCEALRPGCIFLS